MVKDADGTIIFEAGQCKGYGEEYDVLVQKAQEYLDANYPEWEDETKYWDD